MRISSIECGRTLAIMAVMLIHISPFANPFDPTAWSETHFVYLAGFFNQIARFAVPFFFLCSGYFLWPKLQKQAPFAVAIAYCKPLWWLWLVWSLVYILVPFSPQAVMEQGYLAAMQPQWQMLLADPLNQWWTGGMVHLWFLPALIMAVWALAFCLRYMSLSQALWMGGALYLLGLIGGSYGKALFGSEWHLLTRNGPFFSVLLVAIGAWMRQENVHFRSQTALRLMLAGMLLYAIEAISLFAFWHIPFGRHDFLLGSIPWAVGLFGWLLANPQLGKDSWLERLAPHVLGLYCLHMLLVIWVFPVSMKLMAPWWECVKPALVFALSVLLLQLVRRLPGRDWLLRGRRALA